MSKIEFNLPDFTLKTLLLQLFSEFSQTQTPPIFMEEKEQPLSIVIGYNTGRRHESINWPKDTFLRH